MKNRRTTVNDEDSTHDKDQGNSQLGDSIDFHGKGRILQSLDHAREEITDRRKAVPQEFGKAG